MNLPESSGLGAERFRQEFARMVARPEEDLDVALAALLIAGEEYPEIEIEEYRELLETFATTVNSRAPRSLTARERAGELASYLFEELGFRGNSSNYYSPDNSYFNRVLETRTGIPITLSLLFVEVGRRMGISLHGVGMPGHFLVGLEGEEVYFDPFNGGGALAVEDCKALASSLFGPRMTWDDRYLDPCTKYEFLFRILNNLKVVYERTGAPEKALGITQRMLMVRPDASGLYPELATLQQSIHQYRAAISSLETYLKAQPEAQDASQVKSWIDNLRVTLSRLN